MSGTEFIASKKYDKDNLLNQNIFNYCFSNEAIKLPRKFNCWVREQQRFSNTPIERKIYHYIGQGKSLGLDKRDQFNRRSMLSVAYRRIFFAQNESLLASRGIFIQ